MHDELKWNKLFGAILGTGLAILLLRQVTGMAFAPHAAKKAGYAVAVQEGPAEGTGEVVDTLPDWGTVLPTADVAAGATVSTKCQSCHNFASGGPNLTGPNLWGVEGRAPASHAGFAYSAGMTDQGKKHPQWTYDELYKFLAAPTSYVAGTKMSFVGLKKREDRINVIAWLRTQGGALPVPAPDPSRAAGAAPAAAAGSAPAPDAATTVAAKPAAEGAPVAVDGPAPTGGESGSTGRVSPSSGAAATASKLENVNPGGQANAGTAFGGSKKLVGKTK